ncbi:DUF1289 domain-containing protein [Taylorella asinigenitalis]|uniref:DUF1289 domain-containing protein n=1 Tax=Taylorella asinigenitalis TaxID=84590 RepID=UPI000491C548|nr:DUF1289 domain-containing protein [Taylorella asinigenitalis]
MEQEELFDIPSPCINVCQANSRGFCQGCYRSRDERFNWNTFSNSQKRKVITLCRGRKLRAIRDHFASKKAADADQQSLNQSGNAHQTELF